MEETILEVDPHQTLLKERDVERLTVRDLHFKRSHELTTQGTVLEVEQDFGLCRIFNHFGNITRVVHLR